MNDKVKTFLDGKYREIEERKNKEKQKILFELGIYEKEYSDSDDPPPEYDDYEWDEQTQRGRYFKKVPIEVTDEEYAEILKVIGKNESIRDGKSNIVAGILKGIAVTIYFGILAGLIVAIEDDEVVGGIIAGASFVSGTMFLGFGEIIRLLNDIKHK